MSEKILKATHEGTLKIGESFISCAVLEDGNRVLTQKDFTEIIGRASRGGYLQVTTNLPPFLAAKNLEPFISEDLRCASAPIRFKSLKGGGYRGESLGYKAELLPAVCKVFLLARSAGVLLPSQLHIAKQCEILLCGFADVGIIALVDEATGYQKYREKDELQKILEAYVMKEYLAWTKCFPNEFYEEMFRLRGWEKPSSVKRPQYVGTLTNKIVYSRLPQGVLDELRKINPVVYHTGQRLRKHHQYLTQDIGHEHLSRHLAAVIALMRACDTWEDFERMLERSFPLQTPKREDENDSMN
ncbi:P63C domain-containing protein [Nostoc sp.]|uniref:P63C domain-containing protein n=1 Tax=Nostoc sp. TaxID=1180 RepID=UPI002FFB2AB9